MTAQEIINALGVLGITWYRISCDTKIPERTLSNWAKGKSKPLKSNRNVDILSKYYKKKISTK